MNFGCLSEVLQFLLEQQIFGLQLFGLHPGHFVLVDFVGWVPLHLVVGELILDGVLPSSQTSEYLVRLGLRVFFLDFAVFLGFAFAGGNRGAFCGFRCFFLLVFLFLFLLLGGVCVAPFLGLLLLVVGGFRLLFLCLFGKESLCLPLAVLLGELHLLIAIIIMGRV
jgi:hypothetical protein